MNTTLRLFAAAALLATIAGCGNKGPLVHPASPADEMAVPTTTTAPADATMPAPASIAPAAPADATLPAPASATPATPTDTTTPPPPPPGGD